MHAGFHLSKETQMFRISVQAAAVVLISAVVSAWAVEAGQSARQHPVIGQVFAKYEKAFNAGDAKAIGALWKKDGEFVDPLNNRIVGRETIERLFEDFFSHNPGAKLNIKVLSLKEEEKGSVVVAEILPEITPTSPGEEGPNKATVVLVRAGENWLIEGVKESPSLPASYEHLKALAWLVGAWSTAAPPDAEAEKANQVSVNSTCQWTANKSFLTRTFVTQLGQVQLQGMEIIGWDPQAKTIRSWLFESTGGFTESTWKLLGDKWIITMKGVLAGGDSVSSETTLTKVDDDAITVLSQKRMRGNEPQPDIGPITVHRLKTTPQP
jgi:uncharacterized protein (TIGR02246 family)